MPLPWSGELAGRLDRHTVAFELLRDNPLGDPHERPLHVYVPPGYDDDPDEHYRTVPRPAHRGITGKSSGGFAAYITPMLRPDVFGGFGAHAGDALYEYCYLEEFARATRALRAYDGDIQNWWADFRSRPGFT